MTGPTGSSTGNDFVKVAYANDEPEAELLQGLLRMRARARFSVARRASTCPSSSLPHRVTCS